MVTDLLFYEPSGGLGEFHTTYLGGINLLQKLPVGARVGRRLLTFGASFD
jgi:hypothetical protein